MSKITGQQVYDFRRAKGISRSKMAELAGLTPTKIYNIENGRATNEDENTRLARVIFPDGGTPVGDGGDAPAATDLGSPDLGHADGEHVASVPAEAVPEPAPSAVLLGVAEPPSAVDSAPDVATVSPPSPRALQEADGVRRLGNSEIQTFKSCRRRWWLEWYRGLRLRRESPVGVRQTGVRIHDALSHWYVPDGQPRTDPRHALEATITRHWTEISLSYAENGEEVPPHVAAQFLKDTSLERAMIEGYVQWLAETGEDANVKVVGSEQYLEASLNEGPEDVYIIGRLDVRVQRKHDDWPMFLDHKTVGDFTRPARTLHLDEQMLHYHLLEWLNSDDADKRCQGALYNMMRRVKGTAKAKPPFFDRLYVPHSIRELESYQLRLAGTIHDLLGVEDAVEKANGDERKLKTIVYSSPNQDCDWKCPFVGVCGMFDDGSRAEAMLAEHYTSGDPYDYYTRDREKTK